MTPAQATRESTNAASSYGGKPDDNTGTLDSLLQRMQTEGDFPALSQSIDTINQIVSNNDESVQALSSVLLKDFALTNKVLRLVNSATYSRFGGTISTISRAVMILGFNAVRSLAVTLTLIEHMQKNTQTAQLKEDVLAAYLTGILAHRIAATCGIPDSEEGFICGVFHHLGRLMMTCYFYDESLEIDKRVAQDETVDKAARAVLGVSYEDLGIGVARHWHLPERIVNSIQRVATPVALKSPNQTDKLRLIANLATALCRTASQHPPDGTSNEIDQLRRNFGASLNIGKKQLSDVIEESIEQFLSESEMFVTAPGKSCFLGSIKQWSGKTNEGSRADVKNVTTTSESTPANEDVVNGCAGQSLTTIAAVTAIDNTDHSTALTAGIQDITHALVRDYNLNDLLRIILETMYRGMGFSQVLLCTRDVRSNELRARFGFGARTEILLEYFNVPLGQARDVFQLALNKNADIFIANTQSESVVTRIPSWYRENVNARAFLVLPIVINNRIIGLFYADHDREEDFVIEPHLLQMLKTLRNQAILAIRQKS